MHWETTRGLKVGWGGNTSWGVECNVTQCIICGDIISGRTFAMLVLDAIDVKREHDFGFTVTR